MRREYRGKSPRFGTNSRPERDGLIQYRSANRPGWTVCQTPHYAARMSHPRPFYYLENFCTALSWLQERYEDVLAEAERSFIDRFLGLPRAPAALLVRMIGRKG